MSVSSLSESDSPGAAWTLEQLGLSFTDGGGVSGAPTVENALVVSSKAK